MKRVIVFLLICTSLAWVDENPTVIPTDLTINISNRDGETTLEFGVVDSIYGSVEINYTSNVEISGLQFQIDGVTIQDIDTGDFNIGLELNVQTGHIFISFVGDPLPPGSGTLATINFEVGLNSEICFNDVLVAGLPGNVLDVTVGACIMTGLCDEFDTDSDLWGDVCDNCPEDYNPDQADEGDDGTGDACELMGDLDDNGDINVVDIVELVDIIINDLPFNFNGDLNGDAMNDVVDIVELVGVILDH